MAEIEQLVQAARDDIARAQTSPELEEVRVRHVGRSAALVLLLRSVGELPPEERGRVGKQANIARGELEKLIAARADELERAELERELSSDRIDVTLPAWRMPTGSLHILTQTRRRIEDAFLAMGYGIVDGPEVESEFYNFTALNTPDGHPARSESDTFYLDVGDRATDQGVLLRTQTSPVQIRVMQSQPPPVYVISPGRVYRRDRIDATHGSMFHQVEGLAVDVGLTLADLKGTLQRFSREIFGPDREIRLRTHFFPFTEPSVEVDVSCYVCGGTGDPAPDDTDFDKCRLCRGIGWIEVLGAGMVDPNVFGFVDGYDPEEVSGFAFGMGVERLAMLRHGIPDLRLFTQDDLRFLTQFPGR